MKTPQPAQSNDRKIICVLGMHRSGTSLVTRALNLLGVYLGPQSSLLPAQDNNPTGFWEHEAISSLNEEILLRLGGSWHELPVFTPGWEDHPRIVDLRPRAQALIQEFADQKIWGWKDPRTCLTLPFWQRLLPPMRYVICLRNPLDVARSLTLRDGFSLEKGVGLWLTHLTSALRQTAGQPRVQIFYEDFMTDWRSQLRYLSQFLGTPDQGERPGVQQEMEAFISATLHHHRASVLEIVGEPRIAFPAKALYLVQRAQASLRQAEGGHQSIRWGESAALNDQALEHFSRCSLEAQELHIKLQKRHAEMERQAKQLLEKEQQVEAMTRTFGWRLLTAYGRIKYPYLMPIYKLLGLLRRRPKSPADDVQLLEKTLGKDKM